MIGPISLGTKPTGKRGAGNPHATFDVAGAGNVAWSRCCDTRRRKSEQRGTQTSTYTGAPVLDPTLEGREWATIPGYSTTHRSTGRAVRIGRSIRQGAEPRRSPETPAPKFDTVVTLDLDSIRPCLAGPRNPEDRLDLETVPIAFLQHHQDIAGRPFDANDVVPVRTNFSLRDGAVLIAAITSCTNTANPVNMMAAGWSRRRRSRLVSKPSHGSRLHSCRAAM